MLKQFFYNNSKLFFYTVIMFETQPDEFARFKKRYDDHTPQLHASYDSWLADMAAREGSMLVPFEFDLSKHPEQSIYCPKLDAKDPYPNLPNWLYYTIFDYRMTRSLGSLAYRRLLSETKNHPASSEDPTFLPNRLIRNQAEGKNTIVVTSHFTFPELGYFKALRFRAKKDRPNIHKSGVLLNKLMTRQAYRGTKLVDRFTPVSDVYFSYPRSSSALRHKVPSDATRPGNALFMKSLKPALARGGLEFDAALTGKQIVAKKDDNNNLTHYEIPEVDPESAKLLERFDDALGATLIKSPVTQKWELRIGDVIDIQEALKTQSSAEIVDAMYLDIARSVEELTKTDVEYSRLAPKIGKLAMPSG